MKYITNYREFDEESEMSLLSYISNTPISKKTHILAYMKNGKDAGVCCSSVFDFVEKKLIPRTIHCYTDGEFEWDDREIYHFEKYNLELDTVFVKKVLSIHIDGQLWIPSNQYDLNDPPKMVYRSTQAFPSAYKIFEDIVRM